MRHPSRNGKMSSGRTKIAEAVSRTFMEKQAQYAKVQVTKKPKPTYAGLLRAVRAARAIH